MAEFGAKSATDGDRLLPQIRERIIALHGPLFHPAVDLQGTLDGLGMVICEKIATQLGNRRDSGEPCRTMSKNGFPRPDVSKINGYSPPVVDAPDSAPLQFGDYPAQAEQQIAGKYSFHRDRSTMPPPRFLASNPAIRATTTAARLIWQSKIMTLGVACEILAVIVAAVNWVNNSWWLPNVALTLATLGAVVVATKIAWDYHGRGLNAQQRNDVDTILGSLSLNETQRNEIAESIQSSGLTPSQKVELPSALRRIDVASIVEAQKAVNCALEYLTRPVHGQVVVIHRIGIGRLDVRYLDPPPVRGVCDRQHAQEPGTTLDLVEVATSFSQPFTNPAVLWKHPGSGYFCHTNYDAPGAHGQNLMFSFEDCVPKWRVIKSGDYVLRHDPDSGSNWVQQP